MSRKFSFPKHAALFLDPDEIWGVARLRSPMLILEFEMRGDGSMQPWLWPPDAESLTTKNKIEHCMEILCQISYESGGDFPENVDPPKRSLTRPLPPFLACEMDDFFGILDTRRGLLWIEKEIAGEISLRVALDFEMHPRAKMIHELPLQQREAVDFWNEFHGKIDDEN